MFEKVPGEELDARTDVWAFGVCFYEGLTGLRLFDGESVAEILSNVVVSEPDLARLPPETPDLVSNLIARCLKKNRVQRLRSMADIAAWLDTQI